MLTAMDCPAELSAQAPVEKVLPNLHPVNRVASKPLILMRSHAFAHAVPEPKSGAYTRSRAHCRPCKTAVVYDFRGNFCRRIQRTLFAQPPSEPALPCGRRCLRQDYEAIELLAPLSHEHAPTAGHVRLVVNMKRKLTPPLSAVRANCSRFRAAGARRTAQRWEDAPPSGAARRCAPISLEVSAARHGAEQVPGFCLCPTRIQCRRALA